MNKEDMEYIEQAEAIVWKLAKIVKDNIELLEKMDNQIEHKLPNVRVKIEEAILMQMKTYQKVNELFPRLEEIENAYVGNQSQPLDLTAKSIKLYAPRIWNMINIVSKLKPSSIQDSWRNNSESNLEMSISASYVRKPSLEEQSTQNNLITIANWDEKEHIRRNKKYTDYLKTVGISGKIGQLAINEPIVTSSNLVLKRD